MPAPSGTRSSIALRNSRFGVRYSAVLISGLQVLPILGHPGAAGGKIGLPLPCLVNLFKLFLARFGQLIEHGIVSSGLDLPYPILKVLGSWLNVFSVYAPGQLSNVILGELSHAPARAQPALDAVE
jgi:hypothetical protein